MKSILGSLMLVYVSSIFLGLIITSPSYSKINPETIVGIWLLDEDRGDIAKDASGNGHDGEFIGLNPQWVEGKFGRAFEFDGQDDSVLFNAEERPEHAFIFHQPTDATFLFWVKRLTSPHVAIFWTRGDNTDKGRFNVYAGAGENFGFTYKADDGTPHGIFSRTVELPLKEWTHLAITREGNNYVAYKDGIIADKTVDPEPDLPTAKSWIASGRKGFLFEGILDEIAAFNAVLSEEDINRIMNDGLEKSALAVSLIGKLTTIWGQIKHVDNFVSELPE